MDVKFLQGLQSSYDELTSIESNTFYYTTDTKNLYLGTTLIGEAVAADKVNELIESGTFVDLSSNQEITGQKSFSNLNIISTWKNWSQDLVNNQIDLSGVTLTVQTENPMVYPDDDHTTYFTSSGGYSLEFSTGQILFYYPSGTFVQWGGYGSWDRTTFYLPTDFGYLTSIEDWAIEDLNSMLTINMEGPAAMCVNGEHSLIMPTEDGTLATQEWLIPVIEPSLTLTFNITTAGTTINLSTLTEATYIDWGDGEISSTAGSHVYATGNQVCKVYGVTSINERAFRYCDNLISVVIGDLVTSIGEYAFSDCNSLTSVEIGDSVTEIGAEAFEGCNSLTSVVIPNSITSIGYEAFFYCSSLTSVEIGDAVDLIDAGAFAFCDSLTTMTFKNPTPLETLNSGVIPASVNQIIVPINSVAIYKTADGWTTYVDKITAVATQSWVEDAVAQKTQVQIITWGEDD